MLTTRTAALSALALALTLLPGVGNATHSTPTQSPTPPPSFTAVVVAISPTNLQHYLSDSARRPLALIFCTSRSVTCAYATQKLGAMARRDNGTWVLGMVDAQRDPQLARAYSITTVPTLVAIREGREVSGMRFVVRDHDVEGGLQPWVSALTGAPAPAPKPPEPAPVPTPTQPGPTQPGPTQPGPQPTPTQPRPTQPVPKPTRPVFPSPFPSRPVKA